MVSVEDRPTNLTRVVVLPLPNLRSDLIHRPGEGLRFGKPMPCAARNPLNSPVRPPQRQKRTVFHRPACDA